jgi:3-hydroxy acid dehydrogenase / malonic semialdehyde reductase
MNNTAIITGATSGFGRAIAEKLASEGWNLVITGRRSDRLEELKERLEKAYHIQIRMLCFDVRSFDETQRAFSTLDGDWAKPGVLVNNAGLALGREPIHEGDIHQWEQMIDTNLKGMLFVTKTIAPLMIAAGGGTIINIGSVAGKDAYAGGNVYGASKFAVDGLTKNMRIDLLQYKIRVSQIAPGAAETEFSLVRFGGDQSKAEAVYHGFVPLSAEDIAEAAWFIISRPSHVCINDMVIMPTAQANATTFYKKAKYD